MTEIKKFGLIGFPLGHSISPFIHNELFKIRGECAEYSLFEIERENLKKEYKNSLLSLCGFNVTIPHKTGIIPLLDGLSKKAELFGSVNTVKINDKKAIGYNTDCEGFLRSLDTADLSIGENALILGCGGVSRMFAFESVLSGARVTLAVRESSMKKAETLKDEIKDRLNAEAKIILLSEVKEAYDIIINGTPVGMYPNTDFSPIGREAVEKTGGVFDAVYNPLETKLLSFAKEAGVNYSNGLPMLVLQAAAAQEIWFNSRFDKDALDKVIALCEKELGK